MTDNPDKIELPSNKELELRAIEELRKVAGHDKPRDLLLSLLETHVGSTMADWLEKHLEGDSAALVMPVFIHVVSSVFGGVINTYFEGDKKELAITLALEGFEKNIRAYLEAHNTQEDRHEAKTLH